MSSEIFTGNRNSVSMSDIGPPVLATFLVAVVEIIQVSDVTLLQAHQTGQALHVLISMQQKKITDFVNPPLKRVLNHFQFEKLRQIPQEKYISIIFSCFYFNISF